MGLMDGIKKAVDTASDKINEITHKSEAHAEHEKREIAGDSITAGEKASSLGHEALDHLKAVGDHIKSETH